MQSLSSHRCVCGVSIVRAELRGGHLMASGSTWVHGSVDSHKPSRVQQTAEDRRLGRDHAAVLA